MSTDRSIDLAVSRGFPQPVAAAWRRAFVPTSPAGRTTHLLAFAEVLFRTLGSFMALDYLAGGRCDRVDRQLLQLRRPSLGSWQSLVRDCILAVASRDRSERFFVEAADWYLGERRDEPSEVAGQLTALVELRNELAHGQAPAPGPSAERKCAEVLDLLRRILGSLDWLRRYRLFRVLDMRRLRGRTPRFDYQLAFYVGSEPSPLPESVILGVGLPTGATCLVDQSGRRILETTPFVRVDLDPRLREERLFLLNRTIKAKRLVLTHDATSEQVRELVDWEGGPIPFDAWLGQPDLRLLLHENPLPEGGLEAREASRFGHVLDDRFEVLGPLGEGGMAVVLRVLDRWENGEEVALKLLRPEFCNDETFRRRFRREAHLMKRLRNRRLLPVQDIGNLPDGRMWLTMPVVVGGSLRDRLQVGIPEPAQARAWMGDMLAAVRVLHESRPTVVHRDIKPSNFLVNDQGSLLLTDFGIALQQDEARLTRTRERMGATAYMSPEQRAGKTVGPPSDIYSLGVVVHELLTGDVLGPGEGLKGDVGRIVRLMTRSAPGRRPSAQQVMQRLELVLPGPAKTCRAPAASAPTPEPLPTGMLETEAGGGRALRQALRSLRSSNSQGTSRRNRAGRTGDSEVNRLLRKAREDCDRGRLSDAMSLYDEALQLRSDCYEAYIGRGIVHLERRDYGCRSLLGT